MDIDSLNQQYSIEQPGQQLHIVAGRGEIPVVEIRNEFAQAKISLQGAHVLSWVPQGQQEVIWVSGDATYQQGKSVRGGIPICWPWFGAHDSRHDFPAHGFARTVNWQISKTEAMEDRRTRIAFTMQKLDQNSAMWPPQTEVIYQVIVGPKLELELTTCNQGTQAITIGQALHTYFNVADVSRVMLHGLDGIDYLDKLDGFKRKTQHGVVIVNNEVDRVYLDTINDCVIQDTVMKRNIIILKCGSQSTVVWNPWQQTAAKMGDLGPEGYRQMLCVESANAADDVAIIEPGKQHQLWVQYEVQDSVDKSAHQL